MFDSSGIVMPLIAGLFLLLSAVQVVRTWKGIGKGHSIRGMWLVPFSRSAKNAMWRAVPAGFSGLLAVAILLVLDAASEVRLGGTSFGALFDAAAIIGFVSWMVAWFTVMWWNVPKFLVPPPCRGEPGLVALWRRRRSIRRASVSRSAN